MTNGQCANALTVGDARLIPAAASEIQRSRVVFIVIANPLILHIVKDKNALMATK